MHFGKHLLAKRHEPWAFYYLDYKALKELLEKPMISTATIETPGTDDGTIPPLFIERLHAQVERVVHFFLQQQGALSTTLVKELQPRLDLLVGLEKENLDENHQAQDDLGTLQAAYYQAARTLLLLIQFVDLNVTGLRKILKKHDKLTGGNLSNEYFRHVNNNRDDGSVNTAFFLTTSTSSSSKAELLRQRQRIVLRPLLQDGGLEALYMTLRNALVQVEELRHCMPLLNQKASSTLERWNTWNDGEHGSGTNEGGDATVTIGYGSASHSERVTIDPSSSLQAAIATSTTPFPTIAPYVVVLLQIQAARSKLQKSSDFVRMLAASAALLEGPTSGEDEGEGEEQIKLGVPGRLSNFLNFCSTFLHMTDYYIIAPTSGMYAERLGETAALAGLIIGLNSVSALVSTILYSWWTTYFSYKSALIFASTCQMTGCLVYAAALPSHSLTMVILGRLIGGFGSARSINRRYIADTYPVATRTVASAGFVTAGALGTSAGPALAALLYFVVPKQSHNLYWQVENAPGWTMASLWAVYIACMFLCFTEPDRPHKPVFGRKKVTPQHEQGDEEQAFLLLDKNQNGGSSNKLLTAAPSSVDPPLWKIIPVNTTFFVYFTLKFILESLLSSTSILTDYYFDWSGKTSGWYLAILGLLVLPANWLIAVASQRHDDRDLILTTLAFMLLGCLTILKIGDNYTASHFLLGSVLIFCAANCLEGPNMSLLSKTIPPRYSRGLFNVGLLATESGTLGRAVGDVILTLCGSQGMGHILNNAFGMMAGLSTATIALCLAVYDHLEPLETDD